MFFPIIFFKKRMILNLYQTQTISWFNLQHLFNKMFGFRIYSFWIKMNLFVHYHLISFFTSTRLIWLYIMIQLIQQNTQRPYVTFLSLYFTWQGFWRHVCESSCLVTQPFNIINFGSPSQITYFNSLILQI